MRSSSSGATPAISSAPWLALIASCVSDSPFDRTCLRAAIHHAPRLEYTERLVHIAACPHRSPWRAGLARRGAGVLSGSRLDPFEAAQRRQQPPRWRWRWHSAAPPLDARARGDPLVVRLHQLLQVMVGEHQRGSRRAHARDAAGRQGALLLRHHGAAHGLLAAAPSGAGSRPAVVARAWATTALALLAAVAPAALLARH